MDKLLLASTDLGLLYEIKECLTQNYNMVDMYEISYMPGLSQKVNIDRVLKWFMQCYSFNDAPIIEGWQII